MKTEHVLFIKLLRSSFIEKDEEILSENYNVKTFQFKKTKGIPILKELFLELIFMIKNIRHSTFTYIWFADFHAVIPTVLGRMMGKPVVVVIGGVDASYKPELNYGVKTRLLGKLSLYITTRLATHLLPVTQFTYEQLLQNTTPKLSKKCTLIYNCFSDKFSCKPLNTRNNQAITVCLSGSKTTTLIKGVDYYLKLARATPHVTFLVVGVSGEAYNYLKSISSGNVILKGKVTQKELGELMCASKIICQFSRHEAFGVALLEGISSGCYPVGYNYGGTKEILTNDLGILIDELEVHKGVKAIEKALTKIPQDVIPIQKSIENRFRVEVRRDKLLSFTHQLTKR